MIRLLAALLLFTTTACIHGARKQGVTVTAMAPPAAVPQTFTRQDIKVDSILPPPIGSCSLGATIFLPERARALVIFVHGSGPMNRDGRIGTMHPYADLAEQLAEAGFASIRFDKRAVVAGCAEKLKASLRADHFLKDVVAVASAAHDRADLKHLPLVLLGHSEGVTYVNEITARGWLKPDAVVLIAGLGRFPIDATLMRQLRHQITKPGNSDKARRQAETMLKDGEIFFMRLREGEAKPTDFYIGAYAPFWQDMIVMTEQAVATAAVVKVPSLLVQGSHDENVTLEDFEALKGALESTPKSEAHMLEGLDHLLMRDGQVAVDPVAGRTIVRWLDGLGLHASGEGA